MSSRYEERLVELHSVIAELSRQVEERAKEKIVEEDDDDDDDDVGRRKNDDDDDVGRRKNDAEVASRTSTDIDAQAVEVNKNKLLNYQYIIIMREPP